MTVNIYKSGNAKSHTTLAIAYVAGTSTAIAVVDASVLPDAPNVVTIADVSAPDRYVVVKYESKTNNQLNGISVLRGVPTMTETMAVNSYVRRTITGVEWDAIVDYVSDMYAHTQSRSNPHAVTKAQVGLPDADNTSDEDKPRSAATREYDSLLEDQININSASLFNHVGDTDNPHSVTKEQIGLGDAAHTLTPMANISIEPSAWALQTTPDVAGYPYRASVTYTNCTANHFAQLVYQQTFAASGNLSNVCQTANGLVYIYAKEQPAENVKIATLVAWRN